jgi:peptide/nickel transport system permease protein
MSVDTTTLGIPGAATADVHGRSLLSLTARRFLRNPQARIAVAGLAVLILLATVGQLVASDPIAQRAARRFMPPSLEHPFGTDELRRDLFSRTLVGLRTSLVVALGAVSLGAITGISLGFLAGYAGGWTEGVAMRFIDACLAFPGLVTAMAILTILGPGSVNAAIAIGLLSIPTFARLSRAQMLSEKSRGYVEAARSLGARPLRLIFRQVAPNALPPLLTHVALAMCVAVLVEASLSFLGLGQQPPAPSLGGLIATSKVYLRTAWWYAFFPSAVLAVLLLCLNFLADAINEATNPHARSYRPSRRSLTQAAPARLLKRTIRGPVGGRA